MASNLETKIDRIATAVTSALSALTAKGVTVPEGANVESLAALIESIEAGGESKCIYGSFIPADDSSEIIIDDAFPYSTKPVMFGVAENGFGYVDNSHTLTRMGALIAVNLSLKLNESYSYLISYCEKSSYIRRSMTDVYSAFNNTYRIGNSMYSAMDGLINGETRQIRFKPNKSGGYFLSGKTYYWFVLFGDDAI